VVYTVFPGAFYLPVLLLLIGLIFRGVAFEFRHRSERLRRLWDQGLFLGSAVAVFVQGAAVGAMMRGIPVANGQYAGGAFDFSALAHGNWYARPWGLVFPTFGVYWIFSGKVRQGYGE
jgi:cytochrome bd ubiquinol oxidase subunit II